MSFANYSNLPISDVISSIQVSTDLGAISKRFLWTSCSSSKIPEIAS